MKKITRWHPDTCNCIIEYEWDTEEPAESRHHVFRNCTICSHHAGLSAAAVYETVGRENRSKNRAYGHLLDSVPRLASSDASGGKKLDPEFSFHFLFEGAGDSRRLSVGVIGTTLNLAERSAVLNRLTELEHPAKLL